MAKLGRGLDAIFGDDLTSVLEEIQNDENSVKNEIKIEEIYPNPYQPRLTFDKEKLTELSESIKRSSCILWPFFSNCTMLLFSFKTS